VLLGKPVSYGFPILVGFPTIVKVQLPKHLPSYSYQSIPKNNHEPRVLSSVSENLAKYTILASFADYFISIFRESGIIFSHYGQTVMNQLFADIPLDYLTLPT